MKNKTIWITGLSGSGKSTLAKKMAQRLTEDQQKILAQITLGIDAKMSDDKWHSLPITQTELSILSNHGETIEFAPLIAARLSAVLATTLIRNSLLEDFI